MGKGMPPDRVGEGGRAGRTLTARQRRAMERRGQAARDRRKARAWVRVSTQLPRALWGVIEAWREAEGLTLGELIRREVTRAAVESLREGPLGLRTARPGAQWWRPWVPGVGACGAPVGALVGGERVCVLAVLGPGSVPREEGDPADDGAAVEADVVPEGRALLRRVVLRVRDVLPWPNKGRARGRGPVAPDGPVVRPLDASDI